MRIWNMKFINSRNCVGQYNFMSNVSSAAGTWHCVVLDTTGSAPNTYAAAIADANYVIDDDFVVQQSAIPEFPKVVAAIAVSLLCAISYIFMRRKVIYGK